MLVLGKKHIVKGNLRKAKAAFKHAYERAKWMNNGYYQGISLLNLAAIHISGKNPELAVLHLNAALKFNLPPAELGDIHYNLALAHQMLDHVRETGKHYDLALDLCKQAEPKSAISNRSIQGAMFFMKLKKYKKAIEYLNLSASILSGKELIVQLATVLCMKARCFVESDRTVPEAIQVCEDCTKLCKSVEQDAYVGE